jgi:hypothetical protein
MRMPRSLSHRCTSQCRNTLGITVYDDDTGSYRLGSWHLVLTMTTLIISRTLGLPQS